MFKTVKYDDVAHIYPENSEFTSLFQATSLAQLPPRPKRRASLSLLDARAVWDLGVWFQFARCKAHLMRTSGYFIRGLTVIELWDTMDIY